MKTTIAGILGAIAFALVSVLQAGNSLEDWKTWLVPVAIAALGYLAKDAVPPSGTAPVTKLPLPLVGLLACLLCLALPSCVTSRTTVTTPDGTVTVTETSGPDAAAVQAATYAAALAASQIIAEK